MSKVEQTLPAMMNPISRHLDMPVESGENTLACEPIRSEDKQITDIRTNVDSNRRGAEMTGSITKVVGFKLPETGHEFCVGSLRENHGRLV